MTDWDQPITKRAVQCRICGAAADRYHNRFECQANPAHMADLNTGIFSDLSYPDDAPKTAVTLQMPPEAANRIVENFKKDPKGFKARFATLGFNILGIDAG